MRKLVGLLNKQLIKVLRLLMRFQFRRKMNGFKKQFPEYIKPLPAEIEQKHKEYWSPLTSNIDLSFIRIYSNYSGILDYKYLPEDLRYSVIEYILNDMNTVAIDMDKNRFDLIVGSEITPKSYLKNINGTFLNQNSEAIPILEAKELFNTLGKDFIAKPTVNTYQGKGVALFRYTNQQYRDQSGTQFTFIDLIQKYKKNFIVQECIQQHPEYAKFNESSVNSIRVTLYRSVKTEKVHVLSCHFKVGRKGNVVDNSSEGGLWIHVHKNGLIDDFAYTNDGKVDRHPDNGIKFGGMTLPFMDEVLRVSKKAAGKLYNHRLVGLDVCVNSKGKAIVLEANLRSLGDVQYSGGIFFRSFTDEVLEYCVENKDRHNFKIINY